MDKVKGLFNPFSDGASKPAQSKKKVALRTEHFEEHSKDSPMMSVHRTKRMAMKYIMTSATSDSSDSGSNSGSNAGSNADSNSDSNSDSDEKEREKGSSNKRQKRVEEEQPPSCNQQVHQQPSDQDSSRNGPKCFLCDYCTSAEVRFVSSFISDNIANMDVLCMSKQIQSYILEKRPEFGRGGSHGLEVVSIRRHIRQHMLSPTVRIADMMRHLLNLLESMRNNLERVDEETGEVSADKSGIDIYLKVVTKVLDMYKMSETNKMLFANSDSK